MSRSSFGRPPNPMMGAPHQGPFRPAVQQALAPTSPPHPMGGPPAPTLGMGTPKPPMGGMPTMAPPPPMQPPMQRPQVMPQVPITRTPPTGGGVY